ncbi:MAG TPA: murein transglycosylase A [Alphaproteobacteria bacterium]|nr:murein transglycosylase A [Alphaproteobacteria bacterium]
MMAAERSPSPRLLFNLLAAGALALLAACAPREAEKKPDALTLAPVGFNALPGWAEDDQSAALPALRKSCAYFARQSDTTRLQPAPTDSQAPGIGGFVSDWRAVCAAAQTVPDNNRAAARAFFEREFKPFKAANNKDTQGLFTGYYEAELRGAKQPSARYNVPLYKVPSDLVAVDLAEFGSEFSGRTIAGKVVQGKLRPYDDRATIEKGSLKNKNLELIWVDDAIDAFFLHIQGSGRVQMDDGSVTRVGYAGKNGQPYVAIGRELVTRGVMKAEDVSMQSLRAWLKANPREAEPLMNANRSYVFFQETKSAGPNDGPIGAQTVALTPGRSLAVDRKFLPLGLPIWLDASHPDGAGKASSSGDVRVRRLMVAQDTGGAIRGPVRGDVFFGWGEQAAAMAGMMRDRGEYYLLLPNAVAARNIQPSS